MELSSVSPDGSSVFVLLGGAVLELPAPWLADNGSGASHGRDPVAGQRLHDVADLDLAATIEAASVTSDADSDSSSAARFVTTGSSAPAPAKEPAVCVLFRGGQTATVAEALILDAAKRQSSAYAPDLGSLLRAPQPSRWTGFRERVFDIAALRSDNVQLAAAHAALREDGLVLVRGAPAERGALDGVASLLGIIHETNYGRLFDIRAEDKPANHAFTAQSLGLHTDNPYRRPPPAYQALLCVEPAEEGGVTTFSNALAAAASLRETDPDAFRLLSSVAVTFRYADATAQLEHTRPVIEIDRGGEIASIAYNNRGQAPLPLGLAASTAFYAALAAFVRIASEERFLLRVRFSKGEGAIFNNGKVLHGRSAFSSGAGPQRLLQGCYLTGDSIESNAAVLLDR